MTFADMMQQYTHFETVACRIIDIFQQEGALSPDICDEFSFESFEIDPILPAGTVKIKCSIWWGDDQHYETIQAQQSWLDNFDETTVRAAAKEVVAKLERIRQQHNERVEQHRLAQQRRAPFDGAVLS